MNEFVISFFIFMNYTTNTHLETLINKNLHTLTPREWDVLLLIADDVPNKEIADKLHLTPESVKTYRARIAEKLAISGRDSLGRYARKNKPCLIDSHLTLFFPP